MEFLHFELKLLLFHVDWVFHPFSYLSQHLEFFGG